MEKLLRFIQGKLSQKMNRAMFLRLTAGIISVLSLSGLFNRKSHAAKTVGFNGRKHKGLKGAYDLVIAEGEDPFAITVKAIKKMGGMELFVKKGSTVLIKPNMGWDRTPAQAGNTNPEVVAALVELCYKAGAKRVNVFDITCNDSKRCYVSSGVEKAAKDKGANVYFADDWDTINASFDDASSMQDWPVMRDALQCDTFINVPILKHHGLTRLTLGMKNLMGICGGNRGKMHWDIRNKLVDITRFINPELTVIDAYRVLLRNGPQGGNLGDVEMKKSVIVSTDPTLADIYACKLMDVPVEEVSYISEAIARKYGITDLSRAKIERC